MRRINLVNRLVNWTNLVALKLMAVLYDAAIPPLTLYHILASLDHNVKDQTRNEGEGGE